MNCLLPIYSPWTCLLALS